MQLKGVHRSLRLVSFFDIILILGFLNLYGMQLSTVLDDPGLGWHLFNGQTILSSGQLPVTDSFLATAQPRRWVADQWLADIVMAKIYQVGSWPALGSFFFILFYLTFFLVLYRCVSKVTKLPLLTGFAVLIAFKSAQVQFVARPLLFGFLLFTIVVYLLHEFDERRKLKRLAVIGAPIFLVWSCVHPSFVLGLALMSLYWGALFIDRARGVRPDNPNGFGFLMVIGLCVIATLLNPYGFALYETIIWLGASDVRQIYSEWQPLTLASPEGVFFTLIAAPILLRLVFFKHSFRAWVIFAFFAFGYASIGAVRMLPYFAIVSCSLLVESLAHYDVIVQRLPFWFATQLRKAWGKLELRERDASQGTVTLLALGLVVVLFYPQLHLIQQLQPSSKKFPYESVEFLRSQASQKPVVVLNTMNFGGFIEFMGQGQVQPVVDDRSSLLGDEFYREHFDSLRIGGNWREWASRFNARYLLLSPTQHLSRHLKHCYPMAVVVEEKSASLFDLERMKSKRCE